MAISFECAKCHKGIRVPDALAGREGRCPFCGNVMLVPSPGVLRPAITPAPASASSAASASEPAALPLQSTQAASPAGQAILCPTCSQAMTMYMDNGQAQIRCPSCSATAYVESEHISIGSAPPSEGPIEWFVGSPDGKQHGPLAEGVLTAWIRAGRVPAGSPVWRPGMTRWEPVETVSPFAEVFLPAPESSAPRRKPRTRMCPGCGASVSTRAELCVHCGRDLEPLDSSVWDGISDAMGLSNWGVVVCGVAVIFFFFLPWIDYNGFTCPGFQLPPRVAALASQKMNLTVDQRLTTWILFLLYAVPCFAAGGIWMQLSYPPNRKIWTIVFACAILAIVIACLLMVLSSQVGTPFRFGLLEVLASWFYITVAATIALFGFALASKT